MLDAASGDKVLELKVQTTREGMESFFGKLAPARVAVEVGTHSPWIYRHLERLGHEVIVANARKLSMIYANDRKNDRTDAEILARVARLDPKLLVPRIVSTSLVSAGGRRGDCVGRLRAGDRGRGAAARR